MKLLRKPLLLLLVIVMFIFSSCKINIGSVKNTDSSSNSDSSSSSESSSEIDSSSIEDSSSNTSTTTVKPPVSNIGIPVNQHGQLKVNGTHIVDKNNNIYQLKGLSTHGISWFPDIVTKESFKTLRDNWHVNSIRLAMYVDEYGNGSCYLNNKQVNKELMNKGIQYCIDLGMYVIIDWHVLNPGDPNKYTSDAISFFDEFAKKYNKYPNIIYEICNEPNGNVNWNTNIKPYAEKVISTIRKYDKDAIIIVGTGTWSQDIQDPVNNRLSDKNVVYALHYYAATHKQSLRDRLAQCYKAGLPVLVSEFGNCSADGNGGNDFNEAKKWLQLLDSYHIGYYNWALADKNESCCIFKPGTNLKTGNWSDSQLTESGKFIKDWYTK